MKKKESKTASIISIIISNDNSQDCSRLSAMKRKQTLFSCMQIKDGNEAAELK
jgi:hypothetical protein